MSTLSLSLYLRFLSLFALSLSLFIRSLSLSLSLSSSLCLRSHFALSHCSPLHCLSTLFLHHPSLCTSYLSLHYLSLLALSVLSLFTLSLHTLPLSLPRSLSALPPLTTSQFKAVYPEILSWACSRLLQYSCQLCRWTLQIQNDLWSEKLQALELSMSETCRGRAFHISVTWFCQKD